MATKRRSDRARCCCSTACRWPSGPTSRCPTRWPRRPASSPTPCTGSPPCWCTSSGSSSPSALAVAFDAPGATFRDEMNEDYKAGRAETPWLLPPQFDMIREVMAALAIPVIEAPGFEADDVIATLATEAAERRSEVVIVTGDRDSFQLVAGPLRPRPLQQARRERLLPLRRGGHRRAHRRAPVAVRAARRAAGRPVRQPAGRARGGGEDRGQAAHQVRRPRRDLRPPRRADAQAAREPGGERGAGPVQRPHHPARARRAARRRRRPPDAGRVGPRRRRRPPSSATR